MVARSPIRNLAATVWGLIIGTLGGLIGLGGAEFRLPLLIGLFRFAPLEAIILNKAMSLVLVASALLFRTRVVSLDVIAAHLDVVANLLAGSLIGAWLGAGWATQMKSSTLYKVIAVLLVAIAAVLVFAHGDVATSKLLIDGWWLYLAGALAGLAIGVVASLMGVAGGELLLGVIPGTLLYPLLALILAFSAIKVWRHS